MEERKNGIIFLIVGIAVGVLGFFVTDRYLLKSEENTTNNNQNTQKEEKKDEVKIYTFEEINKDFNSNKHYYTSSYKNSDVAEKYGISKVFELRKDDNNNDDYNIFEVIYYKTANGKKLDNEFISYYPTSLKELTKVIDNGLQSYYFAYFDTKLLLDEIEDLKSNQEYLIIIKDGWRVSIYDENFNNIGNLETVGGSLYYDNDENIAKIQIYDNYILIAEYYEDARYSIYKYTIENGELVKSLSEVLPETVVCAGCK